MSDDLYILYSIVFAVCSDNFDNSTIQAHVKFVPSRIGLVNLAVRKHQALLLSFIADII